MKTLEAVPAGRQRPAPVPTTDLAMMLLIRHFETKLLDLFGSGEATGTTHTCLGQEYVPVVFRPLWIDEDFIFSHHRGHGHYLARFDDPEGLLAEILGRDGAVGSGVGGSQHLLRDRFMSTGVQGQGVPIAVGAALRLRRRRTTDGPIAIAFIGDGTWGQGSVYEALNMAQLWSVPLLLVVENNGIAQTTPVHRHMAGTVAARAAAFDIPYQRVVGNDVAAIRAELAPTIALIRRQPRPVVIEFLTHRLGPHSKGDDTRDPRDVAHLAEADWYRHYAEAFPEEFARLDLAQRDRVTAVVGAVRGRGPARREPR